MVVVNHEERPWEEWRKGVLTRAWSGLSLGSAELTMAEQRMIPGAQSPLHWHYSEEQIVVLSGLAQVYCDEELLTVGSGNTVVFPPRSTHGFKNMGEDELHIMAAFSWPFLEIYYDHDPPGVVTREFEQWDGGNARKLGSTKVDAAFGGPGPDAPLVPSQGTG
jgi:quercetin dioxygenase-like cupin family protein